MAQPYTLRLERSNSGGTAGASNVVSTSSSGNKAQINIHTSMAHQLASRLLLQKQPSLDDRKTTSAATKATTIPSLILSNGDPSCSSELGKLIRRQGSVESGSDKKKSSTSSAQQNGEEKLVRKIKNSMINLFGALTAIEQSDLDSLKVILSKNCFALNDTLESGLYSHFSTRLTLLDAALMLGRRQAAELLLQHGATENPELADIELRKRIVEEVMMDNLDRLKSFGDKPSAKDDEKRVRFLEAQLDTLRKMKAATIEFTPPQQHGYPSTSLASEHNCVVTKYRVEWSKNSSFETVAGSIDLTDMRKTKINVDNLDRGQCYTFRIKAASMWALENFLLRFQRQLEFRVGKMLTAYLTFE
uniref:Fibronectin type-III domain-containing protein n=1 Tax=Ditylenchus dipsaci TaxID=166011 RepID=A0A915DU96_9BILA